MSIPAAAFTTNAEVKGVLGIALADTSFNDDIDTYILQVSQSFETIIGSSVTSVEIVEYHSGTGRDQQIQLQGMPNTVGRAPGITSIFVLENMETVANGLGFYIDDYPSRTIWRANGLENPAGVPGDPLASLAGARWAPGERNIKVTYASAFTAIPMDLQAAARDETVRIFRKRKGTDSKLLDTIGLEGRDDSQATTTVTFSPDEFMPETLRVLRRYRGVFTEWL